MRPAAPIQFSARKPRRAVTSEASGFPHRAADPDLLYRTADPGVVRIFEESRLHGHGLKVCHAHDGQVERGPQPLA